MRVHWVVIFFNEKKKMKEYKATQKNKTTKGSPTREKGSIKKNETQLDNVDATIKQHTSICCWRNLCWASRCKPDTFWLLPNPSVLFPVSSRGWKGTKRFWGNWVKDKLEGPPVKENCCGRPFGSMLLESGKGLSTWGTTAYPGDL